MTVDRSAPIRLNVLGPVWVGRPGDNTPLLTQPRRVAVLVYLTLARPRGLHARDTLISMFWPESDEASGRHALRNALHAIRQSVGDSVIATAGDGLVGVDARHVACDALNVESLVADSDLTTALDQYRGELLRGFHVSNAPDFERWLDAERMRLHELVVSAAWSLVDDCRQRGAMDNAFNAARRAVELSPDDEGGLCRLLELARHVRDRSVALRAYDDFAARQRREFDAEPSANTRRLVRSLTDAPGASTLGSPPVVTLGMANGTSDTSATAVVSGADASSRGRIDERRPGRGLVVGAAGFAAVLVVAFAMSRSGSSAARAAPRELWSLGSATQMTTDEGLEIQPELSPDGRFVAYSAGNSMQMRIFIRALGGARAIPLTNDSSGLEAAPQWSADGSTLLYLSHGGVRLSPAFGGPAQVIVAGDGRDTVTSATWSPDSKQIAFTRRTSLFIQPVDGGAARLVATGVEPHSCRWSPRGSVIACASGNRIYAHPTATFGNLAPSAIIVFPVTGGLPATVTDHKSLNQSPAWSVDGRTLYFVSDRDGTRDVYAVGIDDAGKTLGRPNRLTTGLNVHSVTLGREGRKLAYSVYTERSNIWSMPLPADAAAGPRQLAQVTHGNQVIEAVRITRDGRWLLYDSNIGGAPEIYRVRLPDGEPEQLTNDGHDNFRPDLSPDGNEVAYHTWQTGSRDIFVRRLSDGRVQQVTSTPQNEAGPIWSPDGRLIAFSDVAQASGQPLFVVRRDTSGAWGIPVALGQGSYGSADWSPDSRRLAVAAGGGVDIVDVQSGKHTVIRPPPRPDTNDQAMEQVVWFRNGRVLYLKSHDRLGRATFWSMPASGGSLRQLARLDDPTRPSNRADFATDGHRLYFAIQDRQSDVWVADVVRSPR